MEKIVVGLTAKFAKRKLWPMSKIINLLVGIGIWCSECRVASRISKRTSTSNGTGCILLSKSALSLALAKCTLSKHRRLYKCRRLSSTLSKTRSKCRLLPESGLARTKGRRLSRSVCRSATRVLSYSCKRRWLISL